MGKLKKNWSMALLLLAIAFCMLILNISTLFSPDDYSYARLVAGDDLEITSVSEITQAMKYLYTNWTGRIIPHILVGVFMTTNVVVFKIMNTILFTILLIYITKFIIRKMTYLSLIIAFGFLVYGKMFGEKFAWISGSLNYLWTSTALIIYLYNLYGYFVENHFVKKWQKIVCVIAGFFIAFSHEVMAFVGGAFLGILFLANIKKVWQKSKADVIFLLSAVLLFGIGGILTIIAPGNIARSTLDVNTNGSLLACLGNYKDIKVQLMITLFSMIIVGVLKQKELIKKEIIYFIIPCVIATMPFALMGYFPPRCFVPYESLIIIVAVTNIQIICEHFMQYKKLRIGIACLVTILVFARMLPNTYSAIRYIFPYKLKVTKQLEQAQEKGEKDVVVSKFLFTDKIHREELINIDNFFLDISTQHGVNTYLSLYYQFECVRAISDIDYLIEINTDITEEVEYGIIDKDTLELIQIIPATNKIVFTIPKEKLGTYVVDCRDKDVRNHIKSIRIRAVGEEIQNPDLEKLINQKM